MVVGGGGEHRVAVSGDPLGSRQHGGFDLVGCQHIEAACRIRPPSTIADTRLAADGRPLADQGGDVAINAAFEVSSSTAMASAVTGCRLRRRDLDDLEKAFGASP